MNRLEEKLVLSIKKQNRKNSRLVSREVKLKNELSFLEKYDICFYTHCHSIKLNKKGEGYSMCIIISNNLFYRYKVFVYYTNIFEVYKVNKHRLMKIIYRVFFKQFQEVK